MSAFIEVLRREIDALHHDDHLDRLRMASGKYGMTYGLLTNFNLSKHRNSELAWTLNTDNHVADWPKWWRR